jgi:hypothetical protein
LHAALHVAQLGVCGGTGAVSLAAFAPADQAVLRDLYQMLTTLWALLRAVPQQRAQGSGGFCLCR